MPLILALIVNGIEKGKKVAVPNITMIATINAIIWAGAEPVIVDIDNKEIYQKNLELVRYKRDVAEGN